MAPLTINAMALRPWAAYDDAGKTGRPARPRGKSTVAPTIVIAAGGTGGHMFPAQALAEALLQRGWRVVLSTDPRGARYTQGFPAEVEIRQVASATFARGGLIARAVVPVRVTAGIAAAVFAMMKERPDMVVGFGGYPSIPALAAATILGVPRMIHEANGVLGRVNELFARRVDAVACGVWPTEMPKGVEAHHVGNPVRAEVLKRAGAAYIPPGNYPMSIVVFGGSQGARILSDVVPPALAALPLEMVRNLRVAHQARAEDIHRVQAYYADNGVHAEVAPFFSDLPRRLTESQLVIARAGASSVADITAIGRPSILVPLASAIRDEQTANARGLVEAGGAVLVPERLLTPDALTEQVLSILSQPKAALQMAQAALRQGRPDATERLVDMVETLSQRDGLSTATSQRDGLGTATNNDTNEGQAERS